MKHEDSGKQEKTGKPSGQDTEPKSQAEASGDARSGSAEKTEPKAAQKKKKAGRAARKDSRKRWTDALSPSELEWYLERTRRLAEEDNQGDGTEGLVAYIRFRLGSSEKYGIPFSQAEEIMPAGALASVPSTPEFIAGVISRSGEMLTILDLRAFFRTDRAEHGKDARIIVVHGAGLTVGLLVDDVEGNDYFDPERLATPLPSGGVSNMHYVKGIHRSSVTMLDLEALLSDQAIQVDERMT